MSHSSRTVTRREMLRATVVAGMSTLATSHALAAEPNPAQARLAQAKPEDIGLFPRRLQVAYDLLEKWTTGPDAPIPGAALLVGRGDKTVAPRFFGRQGPERDAPPIRRDALFLLASITKPVVYMAALQMVERGLLNLSDKVTRYIPEFAAHGKEDVLVFHLFTHTSGLPDMLSNNAELRAKHAPLKAFLDGAARDTKLAFKPGTQLRYQSMGTAVVGEIVQRRSGLPIAEYLKREIFGPLGLQSTGLGSQGFPAERIVRVEVEAYQTGKDWDWNSEYWRQLGVPWGGMFSTPEDFAVLCLTLLSRGGRNGVRLWSPATVQMATTNRLNDLPDLPEPIRRTQPWGLGWRMNHPGTAGSWGDLLPRTVFGHTGATGTMVWMDPQSKGFMILFTSALGAKAPWRRVHISNAVAAAFM